MYFVFKVQINLCNLHNLYKKHFKSHWSSISYHRPSIKLLLIRLFIEYHTNCCSACRWVYYFTSFDHFWESLRRCPLPAVLKFINQTGITSIFYIYITTYFRYDIPYSMYGSANVIKPASNKWPWGDRRSEKSKFTSPALRSVVLRFSVYVAPIHQRQLRTFPTLPDLLTVKLRRGRSGSL